MDRTVAQQTWGALANAIDEIYNRNASQLSFEELYRNAYNLVLHKYGTLLYEGVTEKLHQHLTATAKRLEQVPDSSLLEEISTTWAEHQVSIVSVRWWWERTGIESCFDFYSQSYVLPFIVHSDHDDYGP
jgi:cullin 3